LRINAGFEDALALPKNSFLLREAPKDYWLGFKRGDSQSDIDALRLSSSVR
jgi:hypothetical protein